METLRAAESIRSRPANVGVPRLTKYAMPYSAFKKWAYGVLSTTQVTQSVVLLALLFVYRLKMTNPGVKGRSGSEYRLLTVALMLGNKCKSITIDPGEAGALTGSASSGRQHVHE